MRKIAALAAVLLLMCAGGFARAEETGTAPDEWTVLFYFCGSDLESKYGYASDDLKEISSVMFPYDYSTWENFAAMRDVGKVNILIETGGSDYHGDRKPDIRLGQGTGDLCVPYDYLDTLKETAKSLTRYKEATIHDR